jgi:hypothetical protein
MLRFVSNTRNCFGLCPIRNHHNTVFDVATSYTQVDNSNSSLSLSLSGCVCVSIGEYLSADQVESLTRPSAKSLSVVDSWLREELGASIAKQSSSASFVVANIPIGRFASLYNVEFYRFRHIHSGVSESMALALLGRTLVDCAVMLQARLWFAR